MVRGYDVCLIDTSQQNSVHEVKTVTTEAYHGYKRFIIYSDFVMMRLYQVSRKIE